MLVGWLLSWLVFGLARGWGAPDLFQDTAGRFHSKVHLVLNPGTPKSVWQNGLRRGSGAAKRIRLFSELSASGTHGQMNNS